MDRTQILDLMSGLKLYGMRGAYDEVMGSSDPGASTSRPASWATCSSPRSPRRGPARHRSEGGPSGPLDP